MPSLDRARIDPDADRVVRRLARNGHKAYLVGGCVRDILVGRRPKDFDVATSATPNEIRDLFRNCRIIGRRFRLAHVFFGDKIIETSTFRANPREDDDGGEGELLIRRDNVFGSETEDARRRDFTINGLFYDVEKEEVIDHVEGLPDLEARLVRTIGDPDIRFQEDPLRILRAIKFAARLDFAFEEGTYHALLRRRGEVRKCAPPRVLEEIYRLMRGGAARRSMEILVETGVLDVLSSHLSVMFDGAGAPVVSPRAGVTTIARSPRLVGRIGKSDYLPDGTVDEDRELDAEEQAWYRLWSDEDEEEAPGPAPAAIAGTDGGEKHRHLAWELLAQIDAHVAKGGEPSNALVLAALLNPFAIDQVVAPGTRPGDANQTILDVGQPLIDQLRVPRRDAERARQILLFQRRVVPARRRRGRPEAVAGRDYFDDALLLYELTEAAAGRTADVGALREAAVAQDATATAAITAATDDASEPGELDATAVEGDDEEGGDGDEPRKRRRRRRGGRRRRREDDVRNGIIAG